MQSLIKSEYIKGRRSFGRISLWAFPLLVALMATLMMGGRLSHMAAYNWWYMIILPTLVALVCINLTGPEKRQQFFNVSVLPISKAKIWDAKALAGCSYVLLANLLVFGVTSITGLVFEEQYSALNGIAAAFVLTAVMAWQIPLGLFVSARFSSSLTLIGMLGFNLIFSIQDFAGGSLWFIPFSIQARLMAPILGINPNGIPLEAGSLLHDTSVILPGLLITAVLFAALLLVTRKWFGNRGE